MRIALVTTSWPALGEPGGHFVQAEARRLERAGHEVIVVAPPAGGAFGWPGAAARVRQRPERAIEAARWVAAARRRLAAMEVERAIAHWAVPCAWPIAAASRAARLEAVSHGADVRLLTALPGRVRSFVVTAIASRAESWRFVSSSLLDDLLQVLDPATRGRLGSIARIEAPAIEMPDVREAARSRRQAFGGLRLAVSVGRLVASKRVDRAIDHVARSDELDTLVVVGDGPERGRLEELARARRVDARFVGLVGREDALAWIGAADVLLHASQTEGLSTVVREAEALGTCVKRLNE